MNNNNSYNNFHLNSLESPNVLTEKNNLITYFNTNLTWLYDEMVDGTMTAAVTIVATTNVILTVESQKRSSGAIVRETTLIKEKTAMRTGKLLNHSFCS